MKVKQMRSPHAEREVRRDSPIRRARTCYDHLAGVAGVELFDELVRRGWIVEGEGNDHPPVTLTTSGETALGTRGVNVEQAMKSKRKFGYGCLDWTEREYHLGGAIGAETLKAILSAGLVRQHAEGRVMEVLGPVAEWLHT